METKGDDGVLRARRYIVIHCRKCGTAGHNAKTCKLPTADTGGPNPNEGSSAAAPNEPPSTTPARPRRQKNKVLFNVLTFYSYWSYVFFPKMD